MSSINSNLDKPLELIQKTYLNQSTNININNPNENPSQIRSSNARVSTVQPSRKNSVHDIHENTKDELNKILVDIQENLSKFKVLLETMDTFENIKGQFFKLKNVLFEKIDQIIHKLSNQSNRSRASIVSNKSSTNITAYYPQHTVYCIEYFRTELVKSIYVFSSLTFSKDIPIVQLNSIITQPNPEDLQLDQQNMSSFQIIQSIKKDVNQLEEYIYQLTQRYYNHLSDWNHFDETVNLNGSQDVNQSNIRNVKLVELNGKYSQRASIGSTESSTILTTISRKCHMICCFRHE